ncbi:MAG: nuclear transport factor 2 family protein [Sphingomonas sp.]
MGNAEARLKALEDIEAIRMLCADYGRMLDAKDFQGYAALFAEDGEWTGVGAFGTLKGRDRIARFMTETFGNGASAPCVHLMTNFRIAAAGDTASAWSRWTLIERRGEGPALVYAGHYDDSLVRTAEGWRFARRAVSVDIE